jgi:cell wall-associated NlpC family hydrolase
VIDADLEPALVKELLELRVDWGNSYAGPASEGGLLVWPQAAAEQCGARTLQSCGEVLVESPLEALREVPAHRAGLSSEAQMGEFMTLVLRRGDWWLVAGEDGYVSWMRSWSGRVLQDGERQALIARRLGAVRAVIETFPRADGGALALVGGTPLLRVPGTDLAAERTRVGLVNGSEVEIAVARIDRGPAPGNASELLRCTAQYLGAPYRWGGRSILGIDCSGLVQVAALRAGYSLPRDAIQQARVGTAVSTAPEDWRAGDLVFFHEPVDHVGIYEGKDTLLHARGRARRQPLHELGELMDSISRVRRLSPRDRIREESLWARAPL